MVSLLGAALPTSVSRILLGVVRAGASLPRDKDMGGAQEAWPWLSRPRWPQAITWDGGSQHWLLSGPAEISQRPRVHAAPRLDESGSGWGPRARSAHYNQLRPAACDAGPGPSTGGNSPGGQPCRPGPLSPESPATCCAFQGAPNITPPPFLETGNFCQYNKCIRSFFHSTNVRSAQMPATCCEGD